MLLSISLTDLALVTGGANSTSFTSTQGLDKLEGGVGGAPVTAKPQPGTLICQTQNDQGAELNRALTGGINLQCTFFPKNK
jgi:hypothetical protein